ERDLAVAHREDRVVLADPGARSGAEARAALADEDHPRRHVLAGEELHAEHLRLGVAAVPRRAESLLVRHYWSSSADASAASAPLRALPERSCSSAASISSRLQPAAALVICGIVIASTSGPVATAFSASAAGFSAAFGFSSAFGFAARLPRLAPPAPIDSISIRVSLLRWPACLLYPVRRRYLPIRILSPSSCPTTRPVTVVDGARYGAPLPP